MTSKALKAETEKDMARLEIREVTQDEFDEAMVELITFVETLQPKELRKATHNLIKRSFRGRDVA